MNNLIERAQTIRGEVTADANTAERVGSFLEDLSRDARTVDTIDQLKALDDMQQGDVVYVRAHNINGLAKGHGGGYFFWDETPLFSVNNAAGYSDADQGTNAFNMNITPLAETVGTDSQYGANVKFRDGAVFALRVTESGAEGSGNRDRQFEKGDTVVRGRFEVEATIEGPGRNLGAGSVVDSEPAFFLEDNGIYIRPTFAEFNGVGIWKRVLEKQEVSPVMYGAIPTHVGDKSAGDQSVAVQRAFDNYRKVRVSHSFYTAQSILVRRTKQYIFDGGREKPIGAGERNRQTRDDKLGLLWTDQEVDMLVFQGVTVSESNFHLNATQKPDFSSCGIRVDLSYSRSQWLGGYLSFQGDGNTTEGLLSGEDVGGIAFRLDAVNTFETANEDDLYASAGFGSFASSHFNIYASGVYAVFHATAETGPVGTSVNGITLDVGRADMFKRVTWMEREIDFFRLTGIYQTQATLTEAQRNTIPVLQIGGTGSHVDGMVWDRRGTVQSNNRWTHNLSYEFLEGFDGTIGDQARILFGYNDGTIINRGAVRLGVLDEFLNSRFVFPKSNYRTPSNWISRFENTLAFYDKRGTLSVETYPGTTYDFANETSPSTGLTPTNDVTITGETAALNTENDKTDVSFEAGADSDNDFVEYVFSNPPLAGLNLSNGELFIAFNSDVAKPKRIQVIIKQNTSVLSNTITNIGKSGRIFRISAVQESASTEMIIRFIGIQDGSTSYIIDDIFAKNAVELYQYFPYIHTGGGQEILGPLQAEDFVLPYPAITEGVAEIGYVPRTKRVIRQLSLAEIQALGDTSIQILTSTEYMIKDMYIRYISGSTAWGSQSIFLESASFNRQFADFDVSLLASSGARLYEMNRLYPQGRYGGDLNLSAGANPAGGNIIFAVVVDYTEWQ